MKIIQPNIDAQYGQRIKNDLLRLIEQPSATEAPPCPDCKLHSHIACSSSCEQASKQLSSDAVNYPIETNVVPLVYELSTVRLIQPCWSCEGHLNPEGVLWKIPQVSFYSQSPIYAQLLLRHISALNLQKRLTYPWHVTLSDYGQTWDVTYTLEPNLNYAQTHHVQLNLLQHDLTTLAENLGTKLKLLAQAMLNELETP